MTYTQQQLEEYRAMAKRLPALPKGCVFVPGPGLPVGQVEVDGWGLNTKYAVDVWKHSGSWSLDSEMMAYAVPADSDIARQYGISLTEPPPLDEWPEWAEWWAQDADGQRCYYSSKPEMATQTFVQRGRFQDDGYYRRPNPAWFLSLTPRPAQGNPDDCAFVEIEQSKDGTLHEVDYRARYDALRHAVDAALSHGLETDDLGQTLGYLQAVIDHADREDV